MPSRPASTGCCGCWSASGCNPLALGCGGERALQRDERDRVVCPSHVQREQLDRLLGQMVRLAQSLDGKRKVCCLAVRSEAQIEPTEHLVKAWVSLRVRTAERILRDVSRRAMGRSSWSRFPANSGVLGIGTITLPDVDKPWHRRNGHGMLAPHCRKPPPAS
jgi:hypothetical protein